MLWSTDSELRDLVERFHDRTLPKPEWTHFAHLAVATSQVYELGRSRALRS